MRSLSASATPDTSVSSIHPWFADTAILERDIRFVLRGLPWASTPRVGGAILRAATDPNRDATNGAAYLIPDDGEVFRMGNDTEGGVDILSPKSYDVLRERVGTQALCVQRQIQLSKLSLAYTRANTSHSSGAGILLVRPPASESGDRRRHYQSATSTCRVTGGVIG